MFASSLLKGQTADSELPEHLARLVQALEEERTKRGDKPGEWTTVEVTEDVLLSVRSKKRKVVGMVEKVRKVLRGLVGR